MKRLFPLIIVSLFLLIFKISNLDIRLSDTNIYFYTAYELIQGKLLYKDIFFTNLPLFPYLSVLYYFLTAGNLKFFYLTSTIEVIIISFFINYLLYKRTKDSISSLTGSILYILSFIIISTSDHQTGVFSASLFTVLSIFFLEKKRFILAGFLAAFIVTTKAYYLPVLIFLITSIVVKKEKNNLIKFLKGFFACLFIVLLPFFILSPNQIIKDVFEYSLTRYQGISKTEILWFFITHDFIFFIVLIFNLLNFKKNIPFGVFSLVSILFFLIYKDIYYLYLNFLTIILSLSLPNLYYFLKEKFNLQRMVIPSFIFVFSLINIFIYYFSFSNLGKIENLDSIINILKSENPKLIYGVNDITPALSYLTNISLNNNIIDTNESIFRKGFLDKTILTQNAIKEKTIIITHGLNYPQLGIKEEILDGIFDKKLIKNNCKLLSSFFVKAEGVINSLNLFKCYK